MTDPFFVRHDRFCPVLGDPKTAWVHNLPSIMTNDKVENQVSRRRPEEQSVTDEVSEYRKRQRRRSILFASLIVLAFILATVLGVVLTRDSRNSTVSDPDSQQNQNDDNVPETPPVLSTSGPTTTPSPTRTVAPSTFPTQSLAPTATGSNFPSATPTMGASPTNTPTAFVILNRWPSTSNGLSLTVQNALSPDWQETFTLVRNDWDNGIPDAVTLNVQRVAVDTSCAVPSTQGVLKVCNGNAGRTGFFGFNNLLLQDGLIVAATAELNDFYLSDNSVDARRHTLCRHIGNGLGLANVDEDFFNQDLGTCLDSTNDPANNLSPNRNDYVQLAAYYGPVGRRNLQRNIPKPSDLALPEDIVLAYAQVVSSPTNWRTLRHDDRTIVRETDLGGGFILQKKAFRARQ
uniref:Uncharacterized protein n=1 Tax=Phaeodactylum tricornutum TaxID=2850 RepID=A0A8J9XBV0_PHATR